MVVDWFLFGKVLFAAVAIMVAANSVTIAAKATRDVILYRTTPRA